jgi:hypothetical protein
MANKTASTTLTYGKVWKTLSKVDINTHIEKKGNLSYLSWAWAWGVLMEHYPQAEYRFASHHVLMDDGSKRQLDTQFYPDGTASVTCAIEIPTGDSVTELRREMWLPVMDYRNNSISNPTSRQISDTKMRCLVKCLAMYGLGHYIYAGEDLPVDGGTTEADLTKAGMPVDKAPTGGITKEHAEKVAKELEAKKKPKKPTKAQQERMRMIVEIRDNVTHDALNDKSREAINKFLDGLTDGTPKSEVETWYDRMLTVISEYDARAKERVFLAEKRDGLKKVVKTKTDKDTDLFNSAVSDVVNETVGV